jgi:hypothetical protein
LVNKHFYVCTPCDARVGCHPGTTTPLGDLANGPLRDARMAAHAAFDPLWQSGQLRRSAAYGWLSDTLGVDPKKTHIGMFDAETCARVVAAVRARSSATPSNSQGDCA